MTSIYTPSISDIVSDGVYDDHTPDGNLSATPLTVPGSPGEVGGQAGGAGAGAVIALGPQLIAEMLAGHGMGNLANGPVLQELDEFLAVPPPSPANSSEAIPTATFLPTFSAFPSPSPSMSSRSSTPSPAPSSPAPSSPGRLSASSQPHQVIAAPSAAQTRTSVVFANDHFVVQPSALGGLGAFAARDLRQGETILVEEPLLVADSFGFMEAYYALSEEAKRAYLSLHGADEANPFTQVEAIMRYNS